MRTILLCAAAFTVAIGGDALAAPCRDLHGQMVACPPAKPTLQCRDAKTKKPAKCKAAGTEPVSAGIRHFNG